MNRVLAAAVLLLSFTWLGCESDTPIDTGVSSGNHAPVLRSVAATPNPVRLNGFTTLSCLATDADGDDISYSWSCPMGQYDGDLTGRTIRWKWSTAGVYTMHLMVSDGRDVATDSVSVTVQ